MKTAKWASVCITALILFGNAIAVARDHEKQKSKRSYIGVRLDPNPLPKLLCTHLRLKENQGLLVYNIQIGSPADKVGLERDDIIVGFGGKDVAGYGSFISGIRKKGIGAKVELEVIHKGARVKKKITLGQYRHTGKWKYLFREVPKVQQMPNRVFRMEPGDQHWKQIPFEGMPDDFNRFFQQKHISSVSNGDLNLQIEIDGDPKNKDSKIEVHDMNTDKRYRTTVGKIDELPEKYRDMVRRDMVRSVIEASDPQDGMRQFHLEFPPNIHEFDFDGDHLIVPMPDSDREIRDYEKIIRDMEKTLRDINKRLKKIENNNRQPQERMKKSPRKKFDKSKRRQENPDSL